MKTALLMFTISLACFALVVAHDMNIRREGWAIFVMAASFLAGVIFFFCAIVASLLDV